MARDVEPEVLISLKPLLIGIACGIAIVGGALLVIRLRQQPPPPAPVVRLAFAAPPGTELGAGDEPLDAAISPDERQVAFVATSNGMARLWRRALDSSEAQAIAGTEGAHLPAWKPTGRALAFVVRDRVMQVSLPDGGVRDLVEAPGAAGLGWLADGSLLFATANRPIHRLRGGSVADVTTLKPGDRGHVYPIATGTDGDFVYTAVRDDGRRVVRLHAAGQDRDLAETTAHGQLVGDRLLYSRQRALLVQRFDRKSGALAGGDRLLSADVGSANGRGFFTASSRVLLTASPATRARQLWWLEDDRRIAPVGEPGDYWQVRLSPDDRFAAVTYLDPLLRTLDIMVMAASGADAGTRETLTTALAADSDPVWSPDGARVLFRSLQDAVPNLYARRAHVATAQDELMMKSELDETPSDWDDATILFTAPMKATGTDVWQFDTVAREITGVATTSFNESDARFSPDGGQVTFVSDESGRPDIYMSPFPEGERIRVSFAGGARPRWRQDGNAIFFTRDEQIMRADYARDRPMPFSAAVPVAATPGIRDFDVAHQSNRLLALLPVDTHTNPTVSAVVDWR